MPNPNSFNIGEMKVAIFSYDIDERHITEVSEEGMNNILKAITYTFARSDRNEVGANFTAVLAPDVKLSSAQKQQIVSHLQDSGARIISTSSDAITVIYGADNVACEFKFTGGAGFLAAGPSTATALDESADSHGSAFAVNEVENLTQLCQM